MISNKIKANDNNIEGLYLNSQHCLQIILSTKHEYVVYGANETGELKLKEWVGVISRKHDNIQLQRKQSSQNGKVYDNIIIWEDGNCWNRIFFTLTQQDILSGRRDYIPMTFFAVYCFYLIFERLITILQTLFQKVFQKDSKPKNLKVFYSKSKLH